MTDWIQRVDVAIQHLGVDLLENRLPSLVIAQFTMDSSAWKYARTLKKDAPE